ncbi:MAG: hypothetical protein AAF597_08240 [Bacteroidota bacterium]
MHSTPFKPFHVYELNPNHPLGRGLPYTYFLCLTLPQEAAFSVRHNIVGLPVLAGRPRPGAGSLRMPLYSRGQDRSQLDVSGEIMVAIDLIQPVPYDALKPQSRGQILEKEKKELNGLLLSFLALG